MEDTTSVERLPGKGRHFVYHLATTLPGGGPEDHFVSVYIGVMSNLRARMRAHSQKWWWPIVRFDCSEFDEYATRARANDVERETIAEYQPEMNRAGRILVVTHL